VNKTALGILHWLYGPEKFPGLSRNGPQKHSVGGTRTVLEKQEQMAKIYLQNLIPISILQQLN